MATKGNRLPSGKGILYQHTPNVIDEYDFADLHTSYYPLPGMDFHNNPQLAAWVQKYGKAPDKLFQQGLAAPPLGKNTSGIRNYAVEFTGDPSMVVNLDVPLASQTAAVRDTLARMGIKNDEAWFGEPLTPAELLWQRSLELSPPSTSSGLPASDMNPANFEDFARRLAAGDPELDALRNYAAPTLLEILIGQGVPAASRSGPGWGAGGAFGPQSVGKNPFRLLQEEADAARAAGDVLRAQEIESQLGDAERFSDLPPGVNVPAPTDGTREYKVFNPRFVDIKKVASLLGAAGIAGAAGVANAAEPAPVDGPAATLADAAPEEYAAFSRAFEQAMQMPAVLHRGKAVTPDEFLTDVANRAGLSPLSVVNARNRMAGLNYDPADVGADELRIALLNKMRDQQPSRNNPKGWSTGYDPSRHEAPKDRYSLTPEGQQAYQAERAYNLLSTFEEGDHAPIYTGLASTVLSGAGAGFAPYFSAAAGDFAGAGDVGSLFANDESTPAGRMASSMYWWNRGAPDGTSGDSLTGAKYPSLSATTLDGLSTKLSNTDNYLPYATQQVFEGRVYNPDLTMRELSIPTSAFVAAPPISMQPIPEAAPSGDNPYYGRENALLQDLRNKLYRTTPIYPGGASPAEMQQLTRDLRDFDMMNRGFANAEYPVLLKNLGMEPRFMTQAEETAANAPRDMIDGTLLAGGPLKAFKAGTRVAKAATAADAARTAAREVGMVAKYAANEIKDEFPINAAIQASNQQGNTPKTAAESVYDFTFTPMEKSIVTMPDGTPARPDDRYYESHWLPDTYKKRENMLRGLLDRGTNLYKPAVTSPSRASLITGQGQ